MKCTKVFATVLSICFASMMWAQSPPDIAGTSNVGLIDYKTSTSNATSSITTTFADLADMQVFPCLNEDSLVKIEVSFVVKTSSVSKFELRALYDGNPNVTLPASLTVGSEEMPLGYRAFTFLVRSGPGCHTIEVQVRGGDTGSVVTKNRMLTASHN
jgi:hypothetical protein